MSLDKACGYMVVHGFVILPIWYSVIYSASSPKSEDHSCVVKMIEKLKLEDGSEANGRSVMVCSCEASGRDAR